MCIGLAAVAVAAATLGRNVCISLVASCACVCLCAHIVFRALLFIVDFILILIRTHFVRLSACVNVCVPPSMTQKL